MARRQDLPGDVDGLCTAVIKRKIDGATLRDADDASLRERGRHVGLRKAVHSLRAEPPAPRRADEPPPPPPPPLPPPPPARLGLLWGGLRRGGPGTVRGLKIIDTLRAAHSGASRCYGARTQWAAPLKSLRLELDIDILDLQSEAAAGKLLAAGSVGRCS